MAKRIVQFKCIENGSQYYTIESNRILGFIPWFWHTIEIEDPGWPMITQPAIFNKFEDAEWVCGKHMNISVIKLVDKFGNILN